jgi:hypothetical protein
MAKVGENFVFMTSSHCAGFVRRYLVSNLGAHFQVVQNARFVQVVERGHVIDDSAPGTHHRIGKSAIRGADNQRSKFVAACLGLTGRKGHS